jgi:hypothetical protein
VKVRTYIKESYIKRVLSVFTCIFYQGVLTPIICPAGATQPATHSLSNNGKNQEQSGSYPKILLPVCLLRNLPA